MFALSKQLHTTALHPTAPNDCSDKYLNGLLSILHAFSHALKLR